MITSVFMEQEQAQRSWAFFPTPVAADTGHMQCIVII